MAVKKINPTEKKERKAYVYLGPNLPGGVLHNGSIYKEIPAHVQQLKNRYPGIEGLFIEAKEVSAFKKELARQGSEAARIFSDILSRLKKEV